MSIAIERYLSSEFFQEEVERIFLKQMFIAHQHDIAAADDYFSFQLGAQNLTLRNNGANTALFRNVCRHRFNLIDPPGFGHRKFRCNYHGWSYAGDGAVQFMPLQQTFPQLTSMPKLLGMEHASIGGFEFMGAPDPVRTQEITDMLEPFGATPARHGYRTKIHHKCNWKLVVENVLEALHLSYVHPDTFYKSGFSATSPVSESRANRYDTGFMIKPTENPERNELRDLLGIKPSYRHAYIFPNLFISLANELVYYIANVVPINAQETVLHYRLYPTPLLKSCDPKMQRKYMAGAIEYTDKTLKEDRDILESCQIGMAGSEGQYTLSDLESRIVHFHAAYNRQIAETPSS